MSSILDKNRHNRKIIDQAILIFKLYFHFLQSHALHSNPFNLKNKIEFSLIVFSFLFSYQTLLFSWIEIPSAVDSTSIHKTVDRAK